MNRFRIDYDYGTTTNNGTVRHQTLSVPDTSGNYLAQVTQSYSYDQLNRLQSAVEVSGGGQSWKQTFVYDRWGNRTFDAAHTTTPSPLQNPTINAANNNRIDANQGYGYDVAGNLTSAPNQTFTYDAENHQVSYQGGDLQNGGATYAYDGDGRRVKKVTANGTTIFVYDALGQMVAEYTTQSPQESGGTSYLTTDSLGTPRIITDANGNVKARHDYLPFGEEVSAGVGGRTTTQGYNGNADGNRKRWAQLERDDETGLDYAQARYYSATQGRFTSPDPYGGSMTLTSPQSFNRYSYVQNDPLNHVDPTGLMMADAAQGYSSFEGWGGEPGFFDPHFGGPGIIQNGMDGFPDRDKNEDEDSPDKSGGKDNSDLAEGKKGNGSQSADGGSDEADDHPQDVAGPTCAVVVPDGNKDLYEMSIIMSHENSVFTGAAGKQQWETSTQQRTGRLIGDVVLGDEAYALASSIWNAYMIEKNARLPHTASLSDYVTKPKNAYLNNSKLRQEGIDNLNKMKNSTRGSSYCQELRRIVTAAMDIYNFGPKYDFIEWRAARSNDKHGVPQVWNFQGVTRIADSVFASNHIKYPN